MQKAKIKSDGKIRTHSNLHEIKSFARCLYGGSGDGGDGKRFLFSFWREMYSVHTASGTQEGML